MTMAGNNSDFRFIIQTDLKLNTGSLKQLLADVATVDRQIKQYYKRNNNIKLALAVDPKQSMHNLQQQTSKLVKSYNNGQVPHVKIPVKLDTSVVDSLHTKLNAVKAQIDAINRGAHSLPSIRGARLEIDQAHVNKEKIQKEIGNIEATVKVNVRLNEQSVRTIQNQLQSSLNSTIGNGRHSSGLQRVGSRQPQQVVQEAVQSRQRSVGSTTDLFKNGIASPQIGANLSKSMEMMRKTVNELEKKVNTEKENYAKRVKQLEKVLSNDSQKTLTIGGKKFNREEGIASLEKFIKGFEKDLNTLNDFRNNRIPKAMESIKQFNKLSSENYEYGKTKRLSEGHGARQQIELDRKQQREVEALAKKQSAELESIQRKKAKMLEERANYPIGKTSRLPEGHPLAVLNRDIKAQRALEEKTRKDQEKARKDLEAQQEKERKAIERQQQALKDKIANTPFGQVSNLPKNHPVRIEVENKQKEEEALRKEHEKQQRDLAKQQEADQRKIARDRERLQNRIANTPVGKVSNLPKNHGVRLLIEKEKQYEKEFQQLLKEEEELKKARQKLADQVANTKYGAVSQLPKGHDVRVMVEEARKQAKTNEKVAKSYNQAYFDAEKKATGKTSQLIANADKSKLGAFYVKTLTGQDEVNQSTINRAQEILGRIGQSNHNMNIKDPRTLKMLGALHDPDRSPEEQNLALKDWENMNREIAMRNKTSFNSDINRYTRNSNGDIVKVKEMTRNFNELGDVVTKGNRSFGDLFRTIATNSFFYGAVTQGFYAIQQAISATVGDMLEFEKRYSVISAMKMDLSTGKENPMYSNVKTGDSVDAIYGLSQKYGLSATQNVAPVYTDVLRRTNLVTGADGKIDNKKVKDIVDTTLSFTNIATNGNPDENSQMKINQDLMSLASAFEGHNVFGKGTDIAKNLKYFTDFNAVLQNKGASTSTVLDVMGELSPELISKNVDIGKFTSLVGAYTRKDADTTGANTGMIARLFLSSLSDAQNVGSRANDAMKVMKIDPTGKDTNQLIDEIAGKIGTLTDAQLTNVSELLASKSGRGGTMSPRMTKLLQSLNSNEYRDYNEAQKNLKGGEADRLNKEYMNNIKKASADLVESFKNLGTNLARLGLFDSIGAFVKALDNLVDSVNFIVEGMANIGDKLKELFGFNPMSIIAGGAGAYLGGKAIGKVATKFGPTELKRAMAGMGDILMGNVVESVVDSVATPTNTTHSPYDTSKRLTPVKFGKPTSSVSRIGGAIGWLISGASDAQTLKGSLTNRKGVEAGKKAGEVFASLLGRGGSITGSLIRFGGMLARLSAVGLALTVAFGAVKLGKHLYDEHKKKVETETKNRHLETYNKIRNKPMTIEEQSHLSGTVSGLSKIFDRTGGTKEGLDMQNAILDLETHGIGFKRTRDKKSTYFEYVLGKDEKGDTVTDRAHLSNKKEMRLFNEYVKNGFDIVQAQKTIDAEDAKKQPKLVHNANIGEVNSLELLNERILNQYQITMGGLEASISKLDVAFMGAENSIGYYTEKLKMTSALMGSVKVTKGQLQTNADKAYRIYNESVVNGRTFEGDAVKGLKLFGTTKDAMTLDIVKAVKEEGNAKSIIDEFKKKESTKGLTTEQAEAVNQRNASRDSIVNWVRAMEEQTIAEKDILTLKDQINQETQREIELMRQEKQLRTELLVAMSNKELYSTQISSVQARKNRFETAYNVALDGSSDKTDAYKKVISESLNEFNLLQRQLGGILGQMNNLKATGQDFSQGALYNPNTELTAEQGAYKQLYEESLNVSNSISSQIEALDQQRSTMLELIMTAENYGDSWSRIQERMKLASDTAKQLDSAITEYNATNAKAQNRSGVYGASFNSYEYKAEQAKNLQEQYLQVLDKNATLNQSYGKDSEKLKKAVAELNGLFGDKLEKAMFKPLSDKTLASAGAFSNTVISSANQVKDILIQGAKTAGSQFAEQVAIAMAKEQGDNGVQSEVDSKTGEKKSLVSTMGVDQVISAYLVQNGYKEGSSQANNFVRQGVKEYGSKEALAKSLAKYLAETPSNIVTGQSVGTINKFLRGKLLGHGAEFVKYGLEYGVDPALMASIAMHETGMGTNKGIKDKNNVGGIMKNGTQKTFETIGDSIKNLAEILKGYQEKYGLDTIPEIQKKYAPKGASNDPNNLNSNWVSGVTKFYNQLTGSNLSYSDVQTIPTGAKPKGSTSPASKAFNPAQYYLSNYQVSGKFMEDRGDHKHTGLDLNKTGNKDLGNPIYAIRGGKVLKTGYTKTRGYYIEVGNSAKDKEVYMHMQGATGLKVGSAVKAGSVLGKIGSTGHSTGSHLHLDTVRNGKLVDPMIILKQLANAINSLTGATNNNTKAVNSAKEVKAVVNNKPTYKETIDAKIGLQKARVEELVNTRKASEQNNKYNNLLSSTIGNMLDPSGYRATESKFSNVYSELEDFTKQKLDNDNSITSAQSLRTSLVGSYNGAKSRHDTKLMKVYSDQIKAVDANIKALQDNGKALTNLQNALLALAQKDPKINMDEAYKGINTGLRKASSQALDSPDQIRTLMGIRDMFQNYMTLENRTGLKQEIFDKTGINYGFTNDKAELLQDKINILFKKLWTLSSAMQQVTEGTQDWGVVIEEVNKAMEEIQAIDLQKLEGAKKYFEYTGKNADYYANMLAYNQSKDRADSRRNLANAKGSLNNELSNGTVDENEIYSYFQIIGSMNQKLIDQMDMYRKAVADAFKAGAVSLDEYIRRMGQLRDIQIENRETAIKMVDALSSGVESSFSGALADAFKGGTDSQQNFIDSMKDMMASQFSSQFSNVILNQSGIGDKFKDLMANMTKGLTSGSPTDIVNFFNKNNFGQQMQDALSPFLPLIQQLTDTTNGIFATLKNQLFNSPSGFKIDDYLYDMAKGASWEQAGQWIGNGSRNESGSNNGNPTSGGGTTIELPPMTNPPTGLPDVVTTPSNPTVPTGPPKANDGNNPPVVVTPTTPTLPLPDPPLPKFRGGWTHPWDAEFHTGGVAGIGNFSSGLGLKPNEVSAVLQKHETIFQPNQVSDLINHSALEAVNVVGGAIGGSATGGSRNDININVTVDGNGKVDEGVIKNVVQDAVQQAMLSMARENRLNDLQYRGYTTPAIRAF
jgi:hypothetical protein